MVGQGRRLSTLPVIVSGLLIFAGFLAPSSAYGAAHPFLETFGSAEQPSFTEGMGMAVDQSTGDLLVIDGETDTVSRWNPDGTPAEFSALGTNVIDGKLGPEGKECAEEPASCDETPEEGLFFGGAGESQVAVDNSGGATDGNIYVTYSISPHAIEVFDEDGTFLGQLTESSEGAFGEPCGVAVDPSGNVYVGDFAGAIHKYEPSANPPLNGDNVANFSFGGGCVLAAGAGPTAGFIFPAHFFGSAVKMDATNGTEEYEIESFTTTLSVDPSSGRLLIATGEGIAEFNVSGASAETFSNIPLAGFARGVAVNGSTGNVYVTRESNANVEVFGPVPEFPLVIKKGSSGGEGSVESAPPGISCGPACAEETAEFPEGEAVELVATAASNSKFLGWASIAGDPGTCTGTTSPCEVTMGAAVELEADFELRPVPVVSGVSPSISPTSGGIEVVITGTGLAEATKVEFGGTAVNSSSFLANTETTIKLKAPGHSAGTFPVIVTTGGGASADTPVDDYTYVATPAVFSVSPNKGSTAGGNLVVISGKNLAGATTVEFGTIVVAAPFAENTNSVIKVIAPANVPGAVDVRVTTEGGTSLKFPEFDRYTFEGPAGLTISNAGTGSGSVACNGGPCAATYPFGTLVTLTAAPNAGSGFAGWSGGGCSGIGSCVVTMSANTTVTAVFNANPSPPPPEPKGTPEASSSASFSGGKVALKISCKGPGACSGTVKLRAKIKGQNKVIGQASFSVGAGETKTVKVSITNNQIKKKLQEGKTVNATLNGGGFDGDKVKLKKSGK
jgi:IPT/TIG domain/Divergent InlB B-repeat domain